MAATLGLEHLNAVIRQRATLPVVAKAIGATVGGGRGLFAAQDLEKGVPIGPIVPISAVAIEKPVVLKQKPKKGAPNTAINSSRDAVCGICLKPKRKGLEDRAMTLGECSLCGEHSHFAAKLESGLLALDAQPTKLSSRFGRIAERALLRCVLEELHAVDSTTYIMAVSLISPDVGEATIEKEWAPLWQLAKERICAVADAHKIELSNSQIWCDNPQFVFNNLLGALHLNAIRGPTTSALYPSLSLANHCCMPSIRIAFDGAMASIVPQRDLKEGEELTIHYAEDASNIKSRKQLQRFLNYNYGFECPPDCPCGAMGSSQAVNPT